MLALLQGVLLPLLKARHLLLPLQGCWLLLLALPLAGLQPSPWPEPGPAQKESVAGMSCWPSLLLPWEVRGHLQLLPLPHSALHLLLLPLAAPTTACCCWPQRYCQHQHLAPLLMLQAWRLAVSGWQLLPMQPCPGWVAGCWLPWAWAQQEPGLQEPQAA